MKDIFNPDSYTEEAMPISSALFKAINDIGHLGYDSSAVKACKEKNKDIEDRFINSLTKDQNDLYLDVQWGHADERGALVNEYFNRGLRFGLLLAKELLP